MTARLAKPELKISIPFLSLTQHAFRCQMVRAVVAAPPAELFAVADELALRDLARSLADWEQSRAMLRAKGYGDIGTSLLDVINAIPLKENS